MQHCKRLATLDTDSEEWRRECEAREWLTRWTTLQREKGLGPANAWWADMIQKIERSRGPGAALTLRNDMNKARNESRQDGRKP
jgi:hypothetical protein